MSGTEISYTDLRDDLADILNRIEYRDETFVITRRGKPIARLVSARDPFADEPATIKTESCPADNCDHGYVDLIEYRDDDGSVVLAGE